MSEVWNVGGGVSADPVVSAVLGAVGKRYLVESWKADDGRSWFNRYSDGFIEQGGRVVTAAANLFDITFPMAFSSTNYSFLATMGDTYTGDSGDWYIQISSGRTPTSIRVSCRTRSADWYACGY